MCHSICSSFSCFYNRLENITYAKVKVDQIDHMNVRIQIIIFRDRAVIYVEECGGMTQELRRNFIYIPSNATWQSGRLQFKYFV